MIAMRLTRTVLAPALGLAILLAATLVPPASAMPAGASVPPPPVGRWLEQAGLGAAAVGLDVRELDTGRPVATLDADRLLNPASLMKLLPVTAALAALGEGFHWQTPFYLDGALADGRLRGHLVMVGDADPKLVIEDLTELIARMRAAGLEQIDGDLVIDDGLFVLPPPGPAFDGQPNEPYNVYPSAGLLNFKSTKFVFTPGRGGVAVSLDPPLAGVRLTSRIEPVGGPCRHGPTGLRLSQRGRDASPEIIVGGRYSVRCGERWNYFAVLDHRQFAEAFFRAAWEAAGGRWLGRARIETGAANALPAPVRAQPWIVWRSPRDLATIAADINKFSNNVMARMLMLRLGAEDRGRGIDEAGARAVVRERLARWGLDLAGVHLENGSGLSRAARLASRTLGDLLVRAERDPRTRALRETLPVAGQDGTMRWRLRDAPVAGQAWIKTGSLDDVRSIAGYVRARSGRLYTVVFIVNDPRARAALPVQDRLLEWLHANG